MRKARVAQWSRFTETWLVVTPQGNLVVRGWNEAMFLAQLLADPHEYIRAVGEAAWENGHSWGWDDARTKARAEHGADIIGPRMTWWLRTANPYEQETR